MAFRILSNARTVRAAITAERPVHGVAPIPAPGEDPAVEPIALVARDRVPVHQELPRRRIPRALRPRRVLLGVAGAAVLLVAAALPAGASWPVASRSSWVSQYYHSTHRADDIAAAGGTRIVPIRDGKVVFAGWKSNCGGYQVWVSHGNGLYSAYYHMSKETSWSGRVVTRQTSTLGYVGKTGCATGNHVHVEVWKGYPWRSGSYRVNPWNYVDSGSYEPYRYR